MIIEYIYRLLNKIDNFFGVGDLTDADEIVLMQYRKIIREINKDLKKSLKEKPYGYAEAKVPIKGDSMRKAVRDYFDKQGYKTSDVNDVLIVRFEDWYSNKKDMDISIR